MVEKSIPSSKAQYLQTIERVTEKDLLPLEDDIITILAINSVEDVKNCNDKTFHIHHLVRSLWKTIESKIEEVK